MDSKLQEIINKSLVIAHKLAQEFVADGEQVEPGLVIMNAEHQLTYGHGVGSMFTNDASKELLSQIMRVGIKSDSIDAIMMVCEGWMLRMDIDKDTDVLKALDGKSVEGHPGKMECVICSVMTKTDDLMYTMVIDRATRLVGEPLELTGVKGDKGMLRGRFTKTDIEMGAPKGTTLQ